MARIITTTLIAFGLVVGGASSASAYDFKCKGERIEKGSSTWGYAKSSGSDFRIEKGSSTIGYAKKRSSKWAIESSGSSTLGWVVKDRIEKSNGSTWTRLDEAKRMSDCPDVIAAALWVLKKSGKF